MEWKYGNGNGILQNTEAEMEFFLGRNTKQKLEQRFPAKQVRKQKFRFPLIWNFHFRAWCASPIPTCPYHDLANSNFQSVSSQNQGSCNLFMHSTRLSRFDLSLFHSKSRTMLKLGNNFAGLFECLRFFFALFKGFLCSGQYLYHSVFAPYSVFICFWQYLAPSLFPGFLYSFLLPKKMWKQMWHHSVPSYPLRFHP
jgi:hypothetical protein